MEKNRNFFGCLRNAGSFVESYCTYIFHTITAGVPTDNTLLSPYILASARRVQNDWLCLP